MIDRLQNRHLTMKKLTIVTTLIISLNAIAMYVGSKAHAREARDVKLDQRCYGVWRGTIGTQEVIVMLPGPSSPEIGTPPGKYYYLRYKTDIELRQKDSSCQTWLEGDENNANATLTFSTLSENSLEGQWIDHAGKHTVPIRLKRVAATNKANERIYRNDPGNVWQGTYVYDQPKISAQKLTVTETRFDNHRYRVISVFNGAIKGMELPETEGKVSLLNQNTRRWLGDQIIRFLGDCRNEKEPEVSAVMNVELWKGSLVVIRESNSYWCGGGMRPDVSSYSATFDLGVGKYVDMKKWIKGTSRDDYDERLKAIVLAKFERLSERDHDDQCFTYAAEMGFSLSKLSNNGLMFSPILMNESNVCGDGVEIPFSQVMPFLTPEGKAAIQPLMK